MRFCFIGVGGSVAHDSASGKNQSLVGAGGFCVVWVSIAYLPLADTAYCPIGAGLVGEDTGASATESLESLVFASAFFLSLALRLS